MRTSIPSPVVTGSAPASGEAPPVTGDTPPAGDGSIRRLYEEHHGPLLRYVSGLVRGDRQRAEDFVQETLVRAWQSTASQPPGWAPSRAWLMRVAHNLVIDWARRERPHHEVTQEHTLEHHAETVDPMSEADQRRFLVHALSRLSHSHREVLFYVYVLGCSGPDAADALGIPPGTVKSRTHHAIRELRRRHPEHTRAAA
ncbi:sigma-70 family RNA polymerase sigma factor [Streptomyces griseiscabiei]|uniref:Sigma-70 family RNA polymerase sigma factor n=1 Tax=Streptomyces griseiscabiei TaxID=2993540 RepID=A0ABU4LHY6_9ACTN|nr:sigma-70 family RNA polymerase sigma factor [Streptomyces griseiscabiei]MBZ3904216.1 sigma-70 family RNA polymerase sigma factor [Streptomyces griseiscabiei]MDX2914799.1 sigma-70 family RNA polymerase sigma factor [Streptomyces griseiscabiei]